MKTIKDVNFDKHPIIPDAIIGTLEVGDFTVSLIQGNRTYSSADTYEVAVFDETQAGKDADAQLWLGEDQNIRGWQSPEEIDNLLRILQFNPESLRQRSAVLRKQREEQYE